MIDNVIFSKIAREYSSPTFVFDRDEVRSRALSIKKLLNDGNKHEEIKLCYSIKANPFLIPCLIDVVDNLEVCSPGELEICIADNVPAGKIIYSGVHKEYEDIKRAIEYDSGVITAESIMHYENICRVADELNKRVKVLPRLSSKSQFGMSVEDIEEILKDSVNRDNIDVVGLHYFAGTQRGKLKHQRKELEELKETFEALRSKYNLELAHFEYGPGLYYPYFADEDFTDTLLPMKELAPDIQVAASWSSVTIEMGRFLASSCGYYISRICDLKSSYDHNWCILDGGINHVNFLGQMMGLKIPVIRVLKNEAEDNKCDDKASKTDSQEWALCGSLCTTNDVLVRSFPMNNPKIGDLLVFENLGAYSITEGIYLFLSRQMPKVVIIGDGEVSLARDIVETWRINSGRVN